MAKRKSGLALHVHHSDEVIEYTWDYDERVACIKNVKPAKERPLRLALLKIIPLRLLPRTSPYAAWRRLEAAWRRSNAAWRRADAARTPDTAWRKSEAAWRRAYAARALAEATYLATIDLDELHRKACHPRCPWDGKTLFSKGLDVETVLGERA